MSEAVEKIKLSDEELLQKLKERREKARLAVKKKEEAIREKNRKNRERIIAEKGKLLEDFGLLDCDSDIWVGALLEVMKVLREDANKTAQWKKDGEYILSLSPAERREKSLNCEKTAGGSEN